MLKLALRLGVLSCLETPCLHLLVPITKTSFYPLVPTSVHSLVSQNPLETARTKFLKHLVDPDMLGE